MAWAVSANQFTALFCIGSYRCSGITGPELSTNLNLMQKPKVYDVGTLCIRPFARKHGLSMRCGEEGVAQATNASQAAISLRAGRKELPALLPISPKLSIFDLLSLSIRHLFPAT